MDRLPQNVAYNPAFVPNVKFHLGLPGMGGVSVNAFNSGFNLNELDYFIDHVGDPGYNPDDFVNSIGDYNTLTSEMQTNIFTLGFKLHEKGYFSVFSTMHNLLTVNATSDIAYLLASYEDLSPEDFPLVVDDVNFLTNNYLSIGFSYSRKINEHLTLGISPKLNLNLLGIKTDKLKYIVTPNEIQQEGGFSDMEYNETFEGEAVVGLPAKINPEAINGDELDLDEFQSTPWDGDLKASDFLKNKSMSLDLGATYEMDQWTFSASILDIGASGWKTNGYLFKGNDDIIKVQELEKISIGIPAKIYLGAKRQFSSKWNYGFVFNNTFFETGSKASGTLSLNGGIGRMLSTSVSYTAGYKYNNLGLGLRLRFFPGMDMYFVTDNLTQAFNYKNAYKLSATFGINFSFGVWDPTKSSSVPEEDDSI